MTRTPTKNALLLMLSITICLWVGCGSSEMKDFSLDTIEAQSEARLKFLADTSLTLPQIKQYTSTRQQLDSLLYYAEWVKNYKEDISLLYAQMGYDLATEENLNFSRAVSAYQLAIFKGLKALYGENIEGAMVDAKISQRLMDEYNRPDWNMHINNLIGSLFRRQYQMDTARYYFTQSLNQLDKLQLKPTIVIKNKAKILHYLGTTMSMSEDSLTISQLYAESDSLYETINEKEGRKELWVDWALLHYNNKKYTNADSLYNLCIKFGQEEQDIDILENINLNKGIMYYFQFSETENTEYFDKSIRALKTSLTYGREKKFQYLTYFTLGTNYHYSWAIDIDESHGDSAVQYYKMAIIKASQEGANRPLKTYCKNLVELCSYSTINCDSLIGQETVTFINSNYLTLLDTLTKHSKSAFQRINTVEQRDIRVNAENNRKNQLYFGLAILGAIGAIFLMLLQGQQNRRLKAEMKALRAQINPHFISNSLNAIESLVNLGNAKAAAKYLVHFSRLSRQILNGSRSATTSLSEELKTLKHFLALEQLRFRDKLTYETRVAEDINQELVLVPAMILQPYVENAIWHGIKPKQTGGKVLIQVQKVGKKLRCIVEDDGIGRAAADKMRKTSVLQHKSMGMQITEERLKGMGRIKGSQVKIEDLMDESGIPCGTRVILQFPYKLK